MKPTGNRAALVAGRLLLLALLGLLPTQLSSQAAIYKWVDANGTITFRDTPPPEGVEATVVDPAPLNRCDTPGSAVSRPAAAVPTEPRKTARREVSVELFTTSWCGYCKQAKSFLQRHGIAYREYDVERDPQAARRKQQLGGGGGVPFALIDGRPVRGFSPENYAAALGLR